MLSATRIKTGLLLLVNLTRQQIKDSPPIESHKPVSRQYEEEYYRYYGLPSYWTGEELWGPNAFPIVSQPPFALLIVSPHPSPFPSEAAEESGNALDVKDPHLRSTHAVTGYHLQTSEETIGHVTDFIMDDKSWAICHPVVEAGTWFSGKEIVISPSHVEPNPLRGFRGVREFDQGSHPASTRISACYARRDKSK
jgi:hypothetical protein